MSSSAMDRIEVIFGASKDASQGVKPAVGCESLRSRIFFQ